MNKTKIEWTDWTANPIRARRLSDGKTGHHCVHTSDGCRNCYAESWNRRFGTGLEFTKPNDGLIEMFVDYKELERLMSLNERCHNMSSRCGRTGTQMIFVGDMTDMFQDAVPDEMLDIVFSKLEIFTNLTIQILTKRIRRARGYFSERWSTKYPDHIWIGTSVENQKELRHRVIDLLHTPASIRFLSAEPLLEGLDFGNLPWMGPCGYYCDSEASTVDEPLAGHRDHRFIDWLIIGGESGIRARRFDIDWARLLIIRSKDMGIPVFMKQIGSNPWDSVSESGDPGGDNFLAAGKGGNPDEWPVDLRVREWPI